MAAELSECTSAADIAAKTQQAMGLKLSTSSVKLLLRKKVPLLTPEQKQPSVRFANLALRTPESGESVAHGAES